MLNSTRPKDHSANKIFTDKDGKVIAVRCNCGKKKCHPVINEEEINWNGVFHEREINGLRKHEKVLAL